MYVCMYVCMKVAVVIATDGESSDGNMAQALQPLINLPVCDACMYV